MQLSFEASVTLELDDEHFARTIDEYREGTGLTEEEAVAEYLSDIASEMEGEEVYSLEGNAWLAFVYEGSVI